MTKVTRNLYGGEAKITFDPEATGKRYTVTDPVAGLVDKKLRGVTTVLGEILDKPGLRMWPLDESDKAIFGGVEAYSKKGALLQPNIKYTEAELDAIRQAGRDAHKARSDRGKDIGTMVHGYVEQHLKKQVINLEAVKVAQDYPGVSDDLISATLKAFGAFVKFWEGLNAKVIGIEEPVYSRRYQFAGCYDITAQIGDKIYMLDLKTTNRSPSAPLGIYAEYFMQLGGYASAVHEGSGMVFNDCGIINVGKDGRIAVALASDLGLSVGECTNAFRYAVAIHDWLAKTKKLVNDTGFVSSLSPPANVKAVDGKSKVNKKESK